MTPVSFAPTMSTRRPVARPCMLNHCRSDAKNMREEFAVYGLSPGFMKVIGFLKVTLAVCLIIGLWVHIVTRPAAIGVAVLMLGAVAMHVRKKDPINRSLPALTLLVLSILVAIRG